MQNIEQYIEQLTRMELKPEALQTAIEILEAVPQIQTELENPSVSKEKKEVIIQKIFTDSFFRWHPCVSKGDFRCLYKDTQRGARAAYLCTGVCYRTR